MVREWSITLNILYVHRREGIVNPLETSEFTVEIIRSQTLKISPKIRFHCTHDKSCIKELLTPCNILEINICREDPDDRYSF